MQRYSLRGWWQQLTLFRMYLSDYVNMGCFQPISCLMKFPWKSVRCTNSGFSSTERSHVHLATFNFFPFISIRFGLIFSSFFCLFYTFNFFRAFLPLFSLLLAKKNVFFRVHDTKRFRKKAVEFQLYTFKFLMVFAYTTLVPIYLHNIYLFIQFFHIWFILESGRALCS